MRTDRFAIVVAAWIAAVAAIPLAGTRLPLLDDPLAMALRSVERDARGAVAIALERHGDAGFAEEVTAMLERLVEAGSAVLDSAS